MSTETKEQRAFDMLERYQGAKAVESLRAELADKTEAYRSTRFDTVLEEEPRWQRETLVRDLAAAGDRAVGADRHRHQAFRTDAAKASPYEPVVRWPTGFDRAKAIKVLATAGVSVLPPGAAFKTTRDASDVWLVGALTQLLTSTWVNQHLDDELIKLGYSKPAGERAWIHRANRPTPPASSPQPRTDAAPEKPLAYRDQWRRGLGVDPREQWQASPHSDEER